MYNADEKEICSLFLRSLSRVVEQVIKEKLPSHQWQIVGMDVHAGVNTDNCEVISMAHMTAA